MRQTTIVKHKEVNKKWFLIDADGVVLGKLATLTASILRGKNKPDFTPNVDMGDNIVIINAEKVVLTANKEEDKKYYSHSGYPGGLKVINAAKLRAKKPIAIVEKAVKGMLPHTKLGRQQFRNLYVYAGSVHKQEAQQPVRIEVK
ncbi:50S RIBOSOMAL PROTEIN L13 [Mycoplasmopsis pulmonis]|uniref:Large ribosomal subunit protein uL13 n=1 Tax=Mycoplasmopsis pulmonis (strain UAB CTIP) TaxID=272635 RepID=RL13_MYCPU|nr:50S ribosomal protein L13 [Mycoplasmopsis pulmonis]Q98Q73.1 RecName: Full=Large ribosomal subunit protein uL13; AltName: Full=50S ribosomal protein L13 [Mycoplasmopsis pulmonis UAB CTIP]MDZ7293495.1 50S ribosomal protein L13 [Mycoplasmopsis pulmonis]CAC13668.1 50S RIBOSOMAL PROTEIN L13 [Mycoplasmopsis pulmonis]VEU68262.1 50S ribosomal protein L13 [Mycoplasmopsis pulmonis]